MINDFKINHQAVPYMVKRLGIVTFYIVMCLPQLLLFLVLSNPYIDRVINSSPPAGITYSSLSFFSQTVFFLLHFE